MLLTDLTGIRRLAHAALRLAMPLAMLLAVAAGPAVAEPAPEPPGVADTTQATGPLRVMFVGDSMTHGRAGSATYRYWMWREFVRQGVPAHFVGPRTDLSTRYVGDAEVTEGYEHLDHGFAGELAHAAQARSTFSYHLPRITEEAETYRPDVVVLQLGFNDTGAHDAPRIAADTAELLRRVWAVDPDIRIVLGEIPPTTRVEAVQRGRNQVAVEANLLVAAAVAGDPRVEIAHHATHPVRAWDPTTDTYDQVHPNQVGETLFAQRFAEALVRLGVFDGPVRLFRREPWTPRMPLTGVGGSRRLTVDLTRTFQLTSTARAQVRVHRAGARQQVVRTWVRRDSPRVSIRLPRGRYGVTAVVRRGSTMVSRACPEVRVVVR